MTVPRAWADVYGRRSAGALTPGPSPATARERGELGRGGGPSCTGGAPPPGPPPQTARGREISLRGAERHADYEPGDGLRAVGKEAELAARIRLAREILNGRECTDGSGTTAAMRIS